MGWTSSTAVIGIIVDGAAGTTSNNALIVGYGSGDFLEVAGANDTVIGSYGNDSLGAIMYPALGMNGNYAYIDGSAGDVFIAYAIQDEQHATLSGGAGNDTFGIGSNLDSKLDVTISDYWVGFDNAGRLTVTLSNIYDYNSVADKYIQIYPYGYRGVAIPRSAWQYVTVGSIVNYGGNLQSIYDNTIVIDNRQSTIGGFLVGNAQANQIYAGKGADFIAGADAFDTVNLYNLNLSDIAAVTAEAGTITLAQDAANAVTIQYNSAISPTFAFADGSRYRFDGATWQNA